MAVLYKGMVEVAKFYCTRCAMPFTIIVGNPAKCPKCGDVL